MLQGHIQIGQDLWVACHDLDQPVGHVPRVSVHDADPVHTRNLDDHLLEQLRQPVFDTQVMPIIGSVLGNQDQFAAGGDGFG